MVHPDTSTYLNMNLHKETPTSMCTQTQGYLLYPNVHLGTGLDVSVCTDGGPSTSVFCQK